MRPSFKLLFFLLLLGCFHLGYGQITRVSCPEHAKYYSKDSINIVTFGASTVQGINGTNFQDPLRGNLSNCYGNVVVNVENYGISGETTSKCLLRIDNAIKDKTGFIVIMAGANDAVQIEAGKMNIRETEANMRRIIVAALNQQLIPILCTIQYFDDRKDDRLKRVDQQIYRINLLYKKLVTEYHLYLADINNAIKRDFSLYQDNVHPNARGNRLIALVLSETINKIIGEKFTNPPNPDDNGNTPQVGISVSQSYPNPTKTGYALIDITVSNPDRIKLEIYNLQGKLVQTVNTGQLINGKHILHVDLSLQPAGIYIYKATTASGKYTATKKLIKSY